MRRAVAGASDAVRSGSAGGAKQAASPPANTATATTARGRPGSRRAGGPTLADRPRDMNKLANGSIFAKCLAKIVNFSILHFEDANIIIVIFTIHFQDSAIILLGFDTKAGNRNPVRPPIRRRCGLAPWRWFSAGYPFLVWQGRSGGVDRLGPRSGEASRRQNYPLAQGNIASSTGILFERDIDICHETARFLATQIPIERWHEMIGDPTYADAILERGAGA